MLAAFAAFGCSLNSGSSEPRKDLPAASQDPDRASDADLPAERRAVFAGGCFWCVEGVFEQLAGVLEVRSGYAGGTQADADYHAVSSGATEHAEVVEVRYDPRVVSYGELLRIFFATHDPTQLNRQGPDHGRQYRSAVFYADEAQREAAAAYIRQLQAEQVYDQPIATTLEELDAFYPAEPYHQDYVQRNPDQPYVRAHALPKIDKLRKRFPEQLRQSPAPETD